MTINGIDGYLLDTCFFKNI